MQTLNRAFNPSHEERLAKEARAEESKFQALRREEGRKGAKELWFAAKAAPGSQRSPSTPANDDRAPSLSLVERNLVNAGFECFMPTYRLVVRHHRNRKLIEKRFPVFTGYVFINLPNGRFAEVEAVEGVGKLLKFSRTYGEEPEPFSFPQATIDRLRFTEWFEDQQFLHRKAYELRQEEVEQELRTLKNGRSKGSRKIRSAQYSELAGTLSRSMTSPSSRSLVMETMSQLLKLS